MVHYNIYHNYDWILILTVTWTFNPNCIVMSNTSYITEVEIKINVLQQSFHGIDVGIV